MDSPSVSVIVTNWNGKHLLPRCLESLRGQRFRSFRTLLVDNGSTDGSIVSSAAGIPRSR
jgi:glycosyltransferase involved in cell wall biosynthesis